MQTETKLNPDSPAAIAERRAAAKSAREALSKHEDGSQPDARFAPKEVRFSKPHVHAGVSYAAGELATFRAIEADALVAAGFAGVKTGSPVDVTHAPGESVAKVNAPPAIPGK